VIFFVPDPAKGVAEMARVVRPGGTVASYAWDIEGGGFPLEPFRIEMNAVGVTLPLAPNPGAAQMEALRDLWTEAGLDAVETKVIAVHRTFADFEDLWTTTLGSPSVAQAVAMMASSDVEPLKARMRARLPADAAGRITYGAFANAIKGRVPK
jgi:hypothetical protein